MPDYQRVLDIAYAEIGYREGISAAGQWNNDQKYSKELPGFAWSNFQPWCDTFVAWCFWKAGLTSALDTVPARAGIEAQSAGVWTSYQAWLAASRFTEFPTKGAQVIYGKSAHTGICMDWDDTYVRVIEGNTNDTGSAEGNGVYLKTRRRSDSYLTGYGIPLFPDGVIISADPAWHHPNPIAQSKEDDMPTLQELQKDIERRGPDGGWSLGDAIAARVSSEVNHSLEVVGVPARLAAIEATLGALPDQVAAEIKVPAPDPAAIAAAIPADLAEQVADELGKRLNAGAAPGQG